MRPQDDYLRNFAVFMTERGIVAVTDPQQIDVYDFLCNGSKRPSDIADTLGFPSSSLHFILDKMVEAGIIIRFKPDPTKKEVYYSTLAVKVVGSMIPSPQVVEYSEETFRNPDGHYTGLASVANMLEGYLGEVGLEHKQLRARYAKELSDSILSEIGSGTPEDVMQPIRDRVCAITGYRMNVFALNPLTIVFEGDKTLRPKIDILSALVKYLVEGATDRAYSIKSKEDFSGEDSVRYKVIYERAEPQTEPYINTSLHQDLDPDLFMVIEVDGGVALITNDIQTKLIETIYERPLCITDIVNAIDMPRSTVTTNLLKMVEEGIASVFYSESGSVYYGLSCSILLKRNKKISKDVVSTRNAIKVATGDGAFIEGYLLYLLASFQELGFETDYMMIVLGAKYMRAAGHDGPRNFDSYFGKMSDIARVVGLSLNVASVYPLTIGINRGDSENTMVPAMTFFKGMAHQGLEMASSGMFVRVSEETPEDMKVSFKEIYPSLSVTPSGSSNVDVTADTTTTKKKRTSSVKEALLRRSAKTDGRPVRTVRYITGITAAMVAVLIFALALGVQGDDNIATADSYTLDTFSDGITILDENGNIMDLPYTVRANTVITFAVDMGDLDNVGVVIDGISYPLDMLYDKKGGYYSIEMDDDIDLYELRALSVSDGLSASIYDFGDRVDVAYAYSFDGYYHAADYVSEAGALWTTENAWIMLSPSEGCYISLYEQDSFFLDRVCTLAWEDVDVSSKTLKADYVTVTLEGDYMVDDYYVAGSLKVLEDVPVTLEFISTDGPVKLTLEQNGRVSDLILSLDRTIEITVTQDAIVSYEHVGIQ